MVRTLTILSLFLSLAGGTCAALLLVSTLVGVFPEWATEATRQVNSGVLSRVGSVPTIVLPLAFFTFIAALNVNQTFRSEKGRPLTAWKLAISTAGSLASIVFVALELGRYKTACPVCLGFAMSTWAITILAAVEWLNDDRPRKTASAPTALHKINAVTGVVLALSVTAIASQSVITPLTARPPASFSEFAPANAEFIGSPTARFTVIAFLDLQCQYCARSIPGLLELERRRPDVRIVFRNAPLSSHPKSYRRALNLASGAPGHLWATLTERMPSILDATNGAPFDDSVFAQASENTKERARRVVSEDKKLFFDLGFNSTPTFVIWKGSSRYLGVAEGTEELFYRLHEMPDTYPNP